MATILNELKQYVRQTILDPRINLLASTNFSIWNSISKA